jgi:HNH endonuclease
MLREVKDAAFGRRLTPVGWRYHATWDDTLAWSGRAFRVLQTRQFDEPVPLCEAGSRRYWLFEDRVYVEPAHPGDGLAAADVRALIRERELRSRRRLERAHAVAAAAEEAPAAAARRRPLPRELRIAVWARDGGACVACGSRFELQYDHVIPVTLGGASTLENLQILCAPCNQRKGAGVA